MIVRTSRWRRWPYEWPQEVPLHKRWPHIMHDTAAWPYQMRIDNTPQSAGFPGPPVGTAVATFLQFFDQASTWIVQPSLIGTFTRTFLTCRIEPLDGEPEHYVWQYHFAQQPPEVWSSNQRRIRWDAPSGPGFFPQAIDFQLFVRHASDEELHWRSFIGQIKRCDQTLIDVD